MSSNRDDFEIGIFCALPLEAHAVNTLIEAGKEDIGKADGDINTYTTGKIGSHNVVLVHMPEMGKIPAAGVAVGLKQSFKKIKLALLVGICGGVPEGDEDIMLGDVIISKQVVHYDFGKELENGFERRDSPGSGRQSYEIRSFIRKLESQKKALEGRASELLTSTWGKGKMEGLQDGLYPADYWHIHQNPENCVGGRCQNGRNVCKTASSYSCEELGCDPNEFIRPAEPKQKPNVYFGSVASGDKVMRSAAARDNIAKKENVIAFDMEAAGIWDYLPCILVKGVSDYADSHKNKIWQDYAAVTAAAYAKAILEQWTSNSGRTDQSARYQVKNQFNNYSPKIGNQADQLNLYGHQTITF